MCQLPQISAFLLRCPGETGPPLLGWRSENGRGRRHDGRPGGSGQNHSVWGRTTCALTRHRLLQHRHPMSPKDLCPRPKELDPSQEPESLPVSQVKARRIIESFENPFRMVSADSVRCCSRSNFFVQTLSVFCFPSSIYPQLTCTSTRTPSLTRLPKYLRWCCRARLVAWGGASFLLTAFLSLNPLSPLCRSAKGGNCWVSSSSSRSWRPRRNQRQPPKSRPKKQQVTKLLFIFDIPYS